MFPDRETHPVRYKTCYVYKRIAMRPSKNIHESFTSFFESPTRVSLRELLRINYGEADHLDFKDSWPDLSKVAKHVLAIANSGGGAIIVGVKEIDDGTLDPVGLADLQDKADIEKKLNNYLPERLRHEVLNFTYDDSEYAIIQGKKFQVVIVESDENQIPYLAKRGGKEIRNNRIYVRRGTESVEANDDEIQRLLDLRLRISEEVRQQGLEEDLRQLQALYNEINLFRPNLFNPGHDTFIKHCIDIKKTVILRKLGSDQYT